MARAVGIGQIYEIPGATDPLGQYQTVFGPGDSPDMWRMIVDCQLAGEANIEYYLQAGLWVLHQDFDIRHGHMSQQCAAIYGSWAMVGKSGNVVRVTSIGDDPYARRHQWPDKVYVGEVYDYTLHDKIDGTSPVNYKPHAVNYAAFNGAASTVWHGVGLASTGKTETWPATKGAPRVLQIGDVCPVCTKEWKQRELATSVYVGCWC